MWASTPSTTSAVVCVSCRSSVRLAQLAGVALGSCKHEDSAKWPKRITISRCCFTILLCSRLMCNHLLTCKAQSADSPTYVPLLQVYSPEVLQAFGTALLGLLSDTALYMRDMQRAGRPHDTGEWLPRLLFLLLQNPLNGMLRLLNDLAGVVVAAETCAAMPRTCMHSGA